MMNCTRDKYCGHNICFELLYFHLLKSPEQILWSIYSFRVAFLSFIKEPGTNNMAIIFVPGRFTFIYQRARNKYYGHYICSGSLYFHLSKSPEKILWPLYLFRVVLISFIILRPYILLGLLKFY